MDLFGRDISFHSVTLNSGNLSRARFANRIRITRFRKFVLLGRLDGDYASPYPQSSFSDIFLTRSDAENVFWLLESQRRIRASLQSGGSGKRQTTKNGKAYLNGYVFPWVVNPKASNCVHEGMGSGIPIEIARNPQNANCGKCGPQANLALWLMKCL